MGGLDGLCSVPYGLVSLNRLSGFILMVAAGF